MRRVLSLSLVVLVAALVAMTAATHAQTPGEAGTIVVNLYLDQNDDGHYSTDKDSTSFEPGCEVWLFRDLTGVRAPSGAKLDDPALGSVEHRPPNADGTAQFSVPPGRYSVASPNCFPWPGTAQYIAVEPLGNNPIRDFKLTPGCCPHSDGTPQIEVVTDRSGKGFLEIQTLTVRSGEEQVVTTRAYPEHDASYRRFVWYAAAILGAIWLVVISPIIVGALWRRVRR